MVRWATNTEGGEITEDERDELLLLYLIILDSRMGTRERVHVAMEVSIAANDDVNRAADRVELLRRVTRGPIMAGVIANRMDEPQLELAAQRKVAVHPE